MLVGDGEDLPLPTQSNDLLSETQAEAESTHPQGDFSAIGSEFSTTGAEAPSQCFPESGGGEFSSPSFISYLSLLLFEFLFCCIIIVF